MLQGFQPVNLHKYVHFVAFVRFIFFNLQFIVIFSSSYLFLLLLFFFFYYSYVHTRLGSFYYTYVINAYDFTFP
jgi:hypothetical protein